MNSQITINRCQDVWDFQHVLSCSGCFNPWLLNSAAKLHGQMCQLVGIVNLFALSVWCQLHLHCAMLFSSYCITLSAISSPQYSSLSLQTLSVVLQKGSSMVAPLFPHVNDSKLQKAILMNALNTYFLKLGKSRIPKKPLLSLLLPCEW